VWRCRQGHRLHRRPGGDLEDPRPSEAKKPKPTSPARCPRAGHHRLACHRACLPGPSQTIPITMLRCSAAAGMRYAGGLGWPRLSGKQVNFRRDRWQHRPDTGPLTAKKRVIRSLQRLDLEKKGVYSSYTQRLPCFTSGFVSIPGIPIISTDTWLHYLHADDAGHP